MSDIIIKISISFILYAYFGYPFILWVIGLFFDNIEPFESSNPTVTVLFAAHNEETTIARTLYSIIESDYPDHLLNVIVVSDASDDRTDDIVNSFSNKNVGLVTLKQRSGKNAAIKSAYKLATGKILIIIDASTVFRKDTIRRLAGQCNNTKIGSVVGTKTIIDTGSGVSKADGLYWRYESLLRSLESKIGASWVGVEGGCFAIKRSLLRMDFSPDLAPDYAICCNVYEQGYRNIYDRSAIIYEPPTCGIEREFQRKVRVIVRGIRAFLVYRHLLNPFVHPGFCFQNISHRLCRWLVPFFLIALFVAAHNANTLFGYTLFYAQSAFYLSAIAGIFLSRLRIKPWITSIPLYFTLMNVSALIAWFLLWLKFDIWKPTKREDIHNSS